MPANLENSAVATGLENPHPAKNRRGKDAALAGDGSSWLENQPNPCFPIAKGDGGLNRSVQESWFTHPNKDEQGAMYFLYPRPQLDLKAEAA